MHEYIHQNFPSIYHVIQFRISFATVRNRVWMQNADAKGVEHRIVPNYKSCPVNRCLVNSIWQLCCRFLHNANPIHLSYTFSSLFISFIKYIRWRRCAYFFVIINITGFLVKILRKQNTEISKIYSKRNVTHRLFKSLILSLSKEKLSVFSKMICR